MNTNEHTRSLVLTDWWCPSGFGAAQTIYSHTLNTFILFFFWIFEHRGLNKILKKGKQRTPIGSLPAKQKVTFDSDSQSYWDILFLKTLFVIFKS